MPVTDGKLPRAVLQYASNDRHEVELSDADLDDLYYQLVTSNNCFSYVAAFDELRKLFPKILLSFHIEGDVRPSTVLVKG